MRLAPVLLCACALGLAGGVGAAQASPLPGQVLSSVLGQIQEVVLKVGATAKIDVGLSAGLNCDDVDVVEAKLVTSKDKKRNVLVIKGKAAGTTYCRAGQPALGQTVLVHIKVEEPD